VLLLSVTNLGSEIEQARDGGKTANEADEDTERF
jgi:hypothetical protein